MELKELIRLVVTEVLAQLNKEASAQKSESVSKDSMAGEILVLLTGGHSIWPKVSYKLSELRKRGFRLTPVVSPAAKTVFNPQGLRTVFDERSVSRLFEINGGGDQENPLEMLKRAAAVILPTLTMNTAAKLSLGIQDTLVTQLTAWALLLKKPVVAVVNAANPGSAELAKFGFSFATTAQRELCLGHLEKLSALGIAVVDADYLLPAVMQALGQEPIQQAPFMRETGVCGMDPASNDTLFVEGVLTREKVLQAAALNYREIIAKGAVTPLAKETASERNIRLLP